MRVILSAGKRIYFTLLASSFMFPISAFAQCVENENCAALGYDSTTACDNGIKCPFGEYWACPEPAKPEGAILGQCTGYAKNCKIGQILNIDGSCSDYRVSGVEPVGIVVYIGENGCGQALALEGLGNFYWSTESVKIPDLPNYSSEPTNDFDSCENTKTVIDYSYKQYGDYASNYYPAFWEVYNYAPSTMPETKGKWCLPAGGVLNSINQNKTAIDQSLTRINKENIGNNSWWSSSEYGSTTGWAWRLSLSNSNFYADGKHTYSSIRPIIKF